MTKPPKPKPGKRVTEEYSPELLAMYAEIGARVHELRNLFGWRMNELAEVAQVSVHQVRVVEGGHVSETWVMWRICAALKVSYWAIWRQNKERWEKGLEKRKMELIRGRRAQAIEGTEGRKVVFL